MQHTNRPGANPGISTLDVQIARIRPDHVRHRCPARAPAAEENPALINPVAFKREDERQQIQRQRKHPQQRNRRDVLAQMVGDRNQQRGRAGGQRDPQSQFAEPAAARPNREVRASTFLTASCAARPTRPPRTAPRTARRPPLQVNACCREVSFGSTRNGKLTSASIDPKFDSANNRYGIRAAGSPHVPGLQQRAGGRQQKIRQSDGRAQQQQNAQRRIARPRSASMTATEESAAARSSPAAGQRETSICCRRTSSGGSTKCA